MKILLLALYWFGGFLMAIGAACALGLALCSLIALFKSVQRKKNIGLFFGYLLAAGLCLLFIQLGFYLAGWIGDRTEYSGQKGLMWGAIFPGIFALSIIPSFIKIALRQTSGLPTE